MKLGQKVYGETQIIKIIEFAEKIYQNQQLNKDNQKESNDKRLFQLTHFETLITISTYIEHHS